MAVRVTRLPTQAKEAGDRESQRKSFGMSLLLKPGVCSAYVWYHYRRSSASCSR